MPFFARAIGRSVTRAVISRAASRMASRGLSSSNRSFAQSGQRRTEMRSRARVALRASSLFGLLDELAEEIGELYEEAGELVEAAYYSAMDIMFGMCGNAGQESVFNDYVIPAFADEMGNTEIGEEWNDVDIGEYMVFMGEIVETGNQIMSAAFGEAAGMADEAEDIEEEIEELEELEDQGLDRDDFF